ncbi:hypothetical protein SBV1_2360010 [Verrucomicrobia bacterium]|nr:hypothetical protein SBV1_2360010 [Verrucomicrobiota bacterium]
MIDVALCILAVIGGSVTLELFAGRSRGEREDGVISEGRSSAEDFPTGNPS